MLVIGGAVMKFINFVFVLLSCLLISFTALAKDDVEGDKPRAFFIPTGDCADKVHTELFQYDATNNKALLLYISKCEELVLGQIVFIVDGGQSDNWAYAKTIINPNTLDIAVVELESLKPLNANSGFGVYQEGYLNEKEASELASALENTQSKEKSASLKE